MKDYLNLLAFFTIGTSVAISQNFIINSPDIYYEPHEEYYEMELDFDITNNTNLNAEVIVTRSPAFSEFTSEDNPNYTNYFCWGEYCYGPSTDVSPNSLFMSSGEVNSSFSAYLVMPEYEFSFTVNYCFSVVTDSSIKTCVDVIYTSIPPSIGLEETQSHFSVYPNPANDVLYVNSYSSVAVDFVLFDVLGNEVYNDVLSSLKSIQLNEFSSGVYFYSFVVNGKNTDIQKLIIAH
ncbi:MAG: hypothetical protein CMC94_01045 [Flavobacteriales bacterium]|nr:hypothetical protein [Flavobacteriales bacterium]|tara:strand:- start:218 stop:922 length:705 start_codon:yes stop_codon:yes gene_type:complete